MKITVNGEELTLDTPCTVAQLMRRYNLADTASAVEVNRQLVPKQQHPERALANGDTVEIVTLVGGG